MMVYQLMSDNFDKSIPTIFIWPEGMLTSTNLKDIHYYKDLFQLNFSNKHIIILGINDVKISIKHEEFLKNQEKKVLDKIDTINTNGWNNL